jgi:hypothetical protein
MGPEPAGFAAFVLVKLAGYSGAGWFLAKAYDSPVSYWKVGAVRTVIGIAAGLAYFGAWTASNGSPSPYLWFLGLIPVRLIEWGFLLRLFFDSSMLRTLRSWEYSAYGAVWSFVLDGVGVAAAFVVPGGFWIC